MGLCKSRLGRRANRTDNRGSKLLRPLAEDEPDTASRRVDKNCVVFSHPVNLAYQILRCHPWSIIEAATSSGISRGTLMILPALMFRTSA